MGVQVAFLDSYDSTAISVVDLDHLWWRRRVPAVEEPNKMVRRPTWSPDGTKLAVTLVPPTPWLPNHFIWDSALRVIDAEPPFSRVDLFPPVPPAIEAVSHTSGISGFSWSPSGREIAYAHGLWVEREDPLPPTVERRLRIVDLETRADRVVYQLPASDGIGEIDWSPDGRRIAFEAIPAAGAAAPRAVGVIHLDAGNAVETFVADADDPHWTLFNPTWSPDNSRIAYFSENYPHRGRLRVMDGNGTNRGTLAEWEEFSYIQHRPTWSRDGSIIAIDLPPDNGALYPGFARLGVFDFRTGRLQTRLHTNVLTPDLGPPIPDIVTSSFIGRRLRPLLRYAFRGPGKGSKVIFDPPWDPAPILSAAAGFALGYALSQRLSRRKRSFVSRLPS